VAHRVEIELESRAEARDLLRALAVRGLTGTLGRGESTAVVVLDYPYESSASFFRDLLPALDAWRLDRGRGPLLMAVEGRRRLLGDPEPPLSLGGGAVRRLPPIRVA
jgi:hypothetical protein